MGLVGFCATGFADSAAFGVASAFNLVALNGNITVGSDVTGRAAASGTITGNSFGADLQGSTPGQGNDLWGALAQGYELVTDGGVKGSGVSIGGGGNVWASSSSGTQSSQFNWNDGGHLVTGPASSSIVDYSTLASSLSSLSGDLGNLAQSSNVSITGPSNSTNNELLLSTTSKTIGTYIFDITSAQFATSNGLNIEVPLGSTVLINVDALAVTTTSGSTTTTTYPVSLVGSVTFNGSQESINTITNGVITGGNNDEGKILFNFANATSVNIGNELVGAVLAPNAAFTGSNQMGGTVMAASINYSGEIHNVEFTGTLPSVPEGGSAWSFLLLGAMVSMGALWWRKSGQAGEAA